MSTKIEYNIYSTNTTKHAREILPKPTGPDPSCNASRYYMMTSSIENIFRVTGHLCGEFTGPRWIPHTKASDAELLMVPLIYAWINNWVNNREAGDLRRQRGHYDVIVINLSKRWSH